MSFSIQLTDTAYHDLDAIMDYIALDNPVRAESFVDELLDKIRSLTRSPKRCPIAPENGRRNYELRHLIHGKYRILFTLKEKDIIILRVIHGSKLLD